MRKPFIFILLSFLISVLIGPVHSLSAARGMRTVEIVTKHGERIDLYGDYHALVVGISNYEKWPKLPNAVNDAREVAEKLKDLGFKVTLVLNPTSREMKTALNEMVYEMGIEVDRALLLYYAGHGETETLADKTNMGYIIPKDCPRLADNPLGFATHAISMRDIESVSLRTRSKHVLMLFDSCFSGALFALVRAVPHDITEKSTLPVRQYITAGREDEQVPDKSMFKRCLLIGLDGDADLTGDGYITGSELGMYLSDKVVNYTHRRQHPQYGKINNPDLDRGDFVFLPLRLRQKEEAKQKKIQGEQLAVTEELGRLREERKKSEELVKKLEQLLEAKQQTEKREKEILAKKRDLEEKLKQAEEEQQINKVLEDPRTKEVEWLKTEKKKLEAERKRLEEEKRRIEVARLPSEATGKEIARDRYFIAYDNGTVEDTKTGLMWAAKDNGRDVTWQEAKEYCENYRGGDYTDWRMPTSDELAGLYDKSKKNQYGYYITGLIDISACCPWASETTDRAAAYFRLGSGGSYWSNQSRSAYRRALPVRSGN